MNFPSQKSILALFLAAYAAIGLYGLSLKSLTAFDSFFAAALLGLALLISKRHSVSRLVAFFAGLIFLPHALGNLFWYDSSILNYHWDWVVHLATAFFFAVVLVAFFCENKKFTSYAGASAVAVAVVVSLGAVIELAEYWSFITIGFGEGYLGFGPGDNSQNFGPWENSSIDTTNNLIGAAFGALFYFLVAFAAEGTKKKEGSRKLKLVR